MTTSNFSKRLELTLSDDNQQYEIRIDNTTKKVTYHSSECSPISLELIQKLVDKLIRLKMITLFGDVETLVNISLDSIDDTDDLYIETFHTDPKRPVNELFDDYDRVMKYDEFLEFL